MTAVVWICGVMLAIGALLALVRIERGPSMMDRAVALDIITATLVVAFALEAAVSRRTDTVPIIVSLLLVGFMGSVTIARFVARESPKDKRILTKAEERELDEKRMAAELAAEENPAPREGTA